MKNILLPVIAIIGLLESCVVGRHLSFQGKVAGPVYLVSKTAMVVVQDNRENVLNGKEKASFCGHTYSTVQIGYNVQTKSGQPLADEFAGSISTTYTNSGSKATPHFVDMNLSADSVLADFKNSNQERLLFFTIKKWEARAVPSFVTIRYEVIYGIELKVYNKNGQLLATAETHDTVTKEEGGATSVTVLQEMADNVFKEKTWDLFNIQDVQKSITGKE